MRAAGLARWRITEEAADVHCGSGSRSVWQRLLRRPVSESGRLRHGNGAAAGGAIAARRVLELATLFSLENLARAVDTFPHMTAMTKIEQQ